MKRGCNQKPETFLYIPSCPAGPPQTIGELTAGLVFTLKPETLNLKLSFTAYCAKAQSPSLTTTIIRSSLLRPL
jgi:hypothetical protein